MKKIQLVARQDIINPYTHRVHDDCGRTALDGIWYGRVKRIEDNDNPIDLWEGMRREFEEENPNYKTDRYSIRFEDGHEIDCID